MAKMFQDGIAREPSFDGEMVEDVLRMIPFATREINFGGADQW